MAYIGNSSISSQSVQPATDFFSGDGVTTAFTLSRTVVSAYTIEAVINNVQQNPSTAYTVSGNVITFTSAPPNGTNNIYVNYNSIQGQVVGIGQGTVGPTQLTNGAPAWDVNGNLTASGNATVNGNLITTGTVGTSVTGAFTLPSGTTAQRPASPTNGMIRKNTTTGYIEYWDPTTSLWIGLGAFAATGGVITQVSGNTIHTFTSSGAFIVTAGTRNVELLIVAGGGGTGFDVGGGGGGGGIVYFAATTLSPGTYTVTIGAGGTSGQTGGASSGNGGNSSFGSLTVALGGGGGGTYPSGQTNGQSGGSGGGAGNQNATGGSGTAGQGFGGGTSSGAWGSGGGGGAAGAGANGVLGAQVLGGAPAYYSISGSSVAYSGGGYGNSDSGGVNPTGQTAGGTVVGYYGFGANGTGAPNNSPYIGNPGIVIVRYIS